MADFAPNYTARYRVRYRAAGQVHTSTFRYDLSLVGGDLSRVVTDVGVMYDTLLTLLASDFAILDASTCGAGDIAFLPAPAPTLINPPNALNPATKGASPKYLSFSALSAVGNGTSFFVYGASATGVSEEVVAGFDYRIIPSENAAIADVLGQLETVWDWWVAADGSRAGFVRQYANFGISAYYQRKARKG